MDELQLGWQGQLELEVLADEMSALPFRTDRAASGHVATPQASLYRRAWVLLVLHHAEQFGRTPISKLDLHALTYLTNVLAPVFDVLAPDRAVMKSPVAPFYPAVQWDIDRLVVWGFVDLVSAGERVSIGSPSYGCASRGRELALRLRTIPRLRAAEPFIAEVMEALALGETETSGLARVDATYGVVVPGGTVIDYGEWDPASTFNFSLRTTEAFEGTAGQTRDFSPRDRVHLYMRYLARVARKAS
jgi:hypothetical protein